MQQYNFTSALILILILNQNVLANDPYISEVVAANDNSLRDNFDESSDWIEIFNPDDKSMNLQGWGLSDNPGNPQKWIFPHAEIEPKGFLLVHASGNNISETGKPLHTNFRLSRSGEFLGLSNPDGTFIDKFDPSFPAANEDNAYGVPMMGDLEEIIPAHSKFHYLTPSSTHAALDWENPDFDVPTTWINAQGGFGFVKSGSSFY
ncbi:MAG: lamin tail domain-containing protein, partial [Verrucomicrobiota bacterium]|nr:lamin tail domain-containing protein [Verrucomicrobiota bacterium]